MGGGLNSRRSHGVTKFRPISTGISRGRADLRLKGEDGQIYGLLGPMVREGTTLKIILGLVTPTTAERRSSATAIESRAANQWGF